MVRARCISIAIAAIALGCAEGGGDVGADSIDDARPSSDADSAAPFTPGGEDTAPPSAPADGAPSEVGGNACPEGDGRYCGARVGREPTQLFECKSGALTPAATCAKTCSVGTGPTGDRCAPCPSGDHAYCGETIGAASGKLYDCKDGVVTLTKDCGGKCQVKAGGDDCATDPTPTPPGSDGLSCADLQWWNVDISYGPYMSGGWWDTDLAVDTHTKIVLRHPSKLDAEGVYDWGWMPEFTDQVTGKRFRFLHLQPSAKYTTELGKIYPAGFLVGLSGGDSVETGLGVYSTGEHLCVQTLEAWGACFPMGKDACR